MKTIALIACCKRKLNKAAPARDLYQGALFKKALAYCEPRYDEVYILSALYGLVELNQVIQPYEKTLNNMRKEDRIAWAGKVVLPDGEYTYFAGERYREFLPFGYVPLANLKLGFQLKWLSERLKNDHSNKTTQN